VGASRGMLWAIDKDSTRGIGYHFFLTLPSIAMTNYVLAINIIGLGDEYNVSGAHAHTLIGKKQLLEFTRVY